MIPWSYYPKQLSSNPLSEVSTNPSQFYFHQMQIIFFFKHLANDCGTYALHDQLLL